MDTPIAAAISKALSAAAGGPIVRLPTIGGSTPFYLFTDVLKMPTFGLSIVNFDNNQHGANENLRIGNLLGRDRIDGGAVDPPADADIRSAKASRYTHGARLKPRAYTSRGNRM